MKPDIIVTWPSGIDYPLFRLQCKLFKKYFNEIIIVTYPHGSPDYRPWLKKNFPEATFVESGESGPAWRETAVNLGLDHSKSDYVLFTEQDFFWKDDRFLKTVFKWSGSRDTIGIRQGARLHPCFLLTKRDLINKTSRDFSVKGQDLDHFTQFTKEIREVGSFIELKEIGLFSGRDWFHFSSMTWNLFRIKDHDCREQHNTGDFLVYNYLSRTNKIIQNPTWIAFTYYAESLLTEYGQFLNL
jgi:hypothetical protein